MGKDVCNKNNTRCLFTGVGATSGHETSGEWSLGMSLCDLPV